MKPREILTVSSAAAFIVVTIFLVGGVSFSNDERKLAGDLLGCYASSNAGSLSIKAGQVEFTSGSKIVATAITGSDKVGQYLVTEPNVIYTPIGAGHGNLAMSTKRPLITFRVDRSGSVNSLYAYSSSGDIIRFFRTRCAK